MRCSHHGLGVFSISGTEFVNDFLECLGLCHNHQSCSTEKYLQCVPLAACLVLQRKFNGRSDMNTSGRPKNAGRLHSNPPANIKSRLGAWVPKSSKNSTNQSGSPTQSIHHPIHSWEFPGPWPYQVARCPRYKRAHWATWARPEAIGQGSRTGIQLGSATQGWQVDQTASLNLKPASTHWVVRMRYNMIRFELIESAGFMRRRPGSNGGLVYLQQTCKKQKSWTIRQSTKIVPFTEAYSQMQINGQVPKE